jgi:hypothetical protein
MRGGGALRHRPRAGRRRADRRCVPPRRAPRRSGPRDEAHVWPRPRA